MTTGGTRFAGGMMHEGDAKGTGEGDDCLPRDPIALKPARGVTFAASDSYGPAVADREGLKRRIFF
jgi:hypothetical protein